MTDSKDAMFKAFAAMAMKPKSDEEHRAISQRWLERIKPTLIDQWPDNVLALSMPTKFIKVPDGLVTEFFALHDGKAPGPIMNSFAAEIDAQMGWDRYFPRLNSRSPKDWPWPYEVPAAMSGREALSILAGYGRVLDDLYEFSWVPEQPAFICLRDWVYWLKGENEFRCFVKDGELIAVTHYDYRKTTPTAVVERAKELRALISAWFITSLKPALHVDTVVFDVAIRGDGEIVLVELNPYGLSDPCWFGNYQSVENATTYIETGKAE